MVLIQLLTLIPLLAAVEAVTLSTALGEMDTPEVLAVAVVEPADLTQVVRHFSPEVLLEDLEIQVAHTLKQTKQEVAAAVELESRVLMSPLKTKPQVKVVTVNNQTYRGSCFGMRVVEEQEVVLIASHQEAKEGEEQAVVRAQIPKASIGAQLQA